ncbi:NRDE family protein [Natronosalvus rutilus]|uniref:NRDE family protein n=1 Tax=Natronosalvus rutilus TaxID=2953753 RepID=A0A9E7N9N4_9EURY|nr:NRDE family protein [Natronosalvus rutilus]UTF53044.1 NRDE family protein [Natronosalvus rutilus]
MCTLTLAWQVFEEAPVVVAANRDEGLERPSDSPDLYATDPLVVAPRDAEAGGTWIGFNDHDLFVGITNRWTDADLAGERSRGRLVADALSRPSAHEARTFVAEAVDAVEFAGFSLVVADRDDAFVLEWDGRLRTTTLEPGIHVVVNVGFDETFEIPHGRADAATTQAENARRVQRELSGAVAGLVSDADETSLNDGVQSSDADPIRTPALEWLGRARTVLGDHEYGVCVHGDGYGTRSSSLIVLGDRRGYAFADGPPCRTPYRDVEVDAGGRLERPLEALATNLTDREGHI